MHSPGGLVSYLHVAPSSKMQVSLRTNISSVESDLIPGVMPALLFYVACPSVPAALIHSLKWEEPDLLCQVSESQCWCSIRGRSPSESSDRGDPDP